MPRGTPADAPQARHRLAGAAALPRRPAGAEGTPRTAALSFPNDNQAPRVIRQARHPTPSGASAALGRLARARGQILALPPHPVPRRRQSRLLLRPAFSLKGKEK